MITYKKGCLVEAVKRYEIDVVAHQANCMNTMKSGVAKALAEAFPFIVEADNDTESGDIIKLGTCSYVMLEQGVLAFNLYGQYGYGTDKQHTNYVALRHSLRSMAITIKELAKIYDWSLKDIGIPKLGCGLGGGDWNVVSKIVEEELKDFNVTVYEL